MRARIFSVLLLLSVALAICHLLTKNAPEAVNDESSARSFLFRQTILQRRLMFGGRAASVQIASPAHQELTGGKEFTVKVNYDANLPLFLGFLFGFRKIELVLDDSVVAKKTTFFGCNKGTREFRLDLEKYYDDRHFLKARGTQRLTQTTTSEKTAFRIERSVPFLPSCNMIWYTVPIYAVRVNNNDGTKPADVTSDQI